MKKERLSNSKGWYAPVLLEGGTSTVKASYEAFNNLNYAAHMYLHHLSSEEYKVWVETSKVGRVHIKQVLSTSQAAYHFFMTEMLYHPKQHVWHWKARIIRLGCINYGAVVFQTRLAWRAV